VDDTPDQEDEIRGEFHEFYDSREEPARWVFLKKIFPSGDLAFLCQTAKLIWRNRDH
jgi:hypothetical protein